MNMLQQNKSLTALKTCSIEFNIANQPFSHLTLTVWTVNVIQGHSILTKAFHLPA